jgi:hypothetical protein
MKKIIKAVTIATHEPIIHAYALAVISTILFHAKYRIREIMVIILKSSVIF